MTAWRLTSWTLRRRVVAICVTVGVLLSGLGVAAVFAAADNSKNIDNILNRIGPMRTSGESLVSAVVNQETGVRGYAISGRPDNLKPYNEGLASEKQLVSAIMGYLGPRGDSDIRAALQEVQRRADFWRSTIATPVIETVRSRGAVAGQALVDAATTTQFDALRAAITVMQQRILVLRAAAVASVQGASSKLVAIEIATAAIVVLAGVLLLLLLDRLVTRPVIQLADEVRLVAKGDYGRHLTSGGSPELRSLADDVDVMRQQIAAELSEVQLARAEVEWINDQLKLQAEELTRSNRDLEQFAYVASHDLQEPLRKVASFCQLLQRRYAGQMDERADQYIGFAVDGAQRMQRLINDLLAFSRIGRLTAGFTAVDLNQVLTQVKSQLEVRAGEDAEISWADLPLVEGEEPLLTTLFVNLIGNSLKFRRPDVPPVIQVSAARVENEWQLTVRDNGIGIEPEFADKVFVIFQRLHARDAYEGTGIGLAIVKKIVEYHGGRIWLDLDVEVGTSINLTLPVVPSELSTPAEEAEPELSIRKEVTA